jgi:signal transduction histidine kinase
VESGKEVSFTEPFDLRSAIEECVRIYHDEAKRRGIDFVLEVGDAPRGVIGDVNKMKTVVANLTANARTLHVCMPFLSALIVPPQ